MDSKINFSLRKLSPMRYKNNNRSNKNSTKIQNFFIKINDDEEDMFNLKDIYNIIEFGDKKHPITKQQILRWSPSEIKEIIYKLNNIELMVKKNFGNSINLITDFILSQVSNKTSN